MTKPCDCATWARDYPTFVFEAHHRWCSQYDHAEVRAALEADLSAARSWLMVHAEHEGDCRAQPAAAACICGLDFALGSMMHAPKAPR